MPVHAVKVDWATHRDRLRAIRARVFIEEQGVAKELEWDGLDESAHHFIALNEAGVALGTARLLNTGQIGRMAVLAEQRSRGIGRQLLETAVGHAVTLGMPRVFLHAQRHAEGFYRKSGFVPTGAETVEAGIEHVEMDMILPIPFEPSAPTRGLPLINPEKLPTEVASNAIRAMRSELDCRSAVSELIATARRTLLILSPSLDPALFASQGCLSAVSTFARRSRHARGQILVEDTRAIASESHPLLELARRLPSKLEMRRLAEDVAPPRSNFIVVDNRAIWVQPDRDAYLGWWNLNDRVEARRLTDQFIALYERASDDPELRLLNL